MENRFPAFSILRILNERPEAFPTDIFVRCIWVYSWVSLIVEVAFRRLYGRHAPPYLRGIRSVFRLYGSIMTFRNRLTFETLARSVCERRSDNENPDGSLSESNGRLIRILLFEHAVHAGFQFRFFLLDILSGERKAVFYNRRVPTEINFPSNLTNSDFHTKETG